MSNHVIIIGCGGREHAIAQTIRRKNPFVHLYCVGIWDNPGIQELTTKYVSSTHWTTGFDVLKRELMNQEFMVVVGPEKPLSEGIADFIESTYEMPCIGPTKEYARIETSKSFLRKLMSKDSFLSEHAPHWVLCNNQDEACEAIDTFYKNNIRVVIKPDGLTSGKGVYVQDVDFVSSKSAKDYIGTLHGLIVLEERLVGQEFTLMSFCDGKTCKHMPIVKDVKRLSTRGPNTGGMGSISFVGGKPFFLDDKDVKVAQEINQTVMKRLNQECKDTRGYKGILYGSFMKTIDGKIKVIEYNARFGDPEAINVLYHLETNLLTVFTAISKGTLGKIKIKWDVTKNTMVKYLVPAAYPTIHERPGYLRLKLHRPISDNKYGLQILLAGIKSKKYHEHQYEMTGSRAVAMLIRGNNSHEELERQLNSHFSLFDEKEVNYRESLLESSDSDSDDSLTDYGDEAEALLTYDDTGVNIDVANQAVKQIKSAVTSTWDSRVTGKFGDFGGSFRISPQIELVSSTDGVGTKTQLVLQTLGEKDGYFSLGQDIVNHCVNDVLVQFAKPLFFLDYLGVPEIKPNNLEALVSGMSQACKQVGCAIVGGETAEMPDIYRPNTCDIVGTMIGQKITNVKPSKVREGDIVIGIKSSGPHTNGYTLIRQLLLINNVKTEIVKKLGLCNVHRCYLKDFENLLANDIVPHAMCHITGGGFVSNPSRVLPKDLTIEFIDWDMPEPFKSIQAWGHLSKPEMMRTFNCGVGFLFIVNPEQVSKVLTVLGTDNAFKCGTVIKIN